MTVRSSHAPLAPALLGAIGASVYNMLASMVTGVMAARLLMADGRGALAEILLWGNTFLALGMAAMPTALAMAVARPDAARNLLSSALLVACAQSVLIIAAFFAAAPLLIKPELRLACTLYAICIVPCGLIGATLLAVDNGRQNFRALYVYRIMPLTVQLVLYLALWLLGLATPAAFASANLSGSALVAVLALIAHRRDLLRWPSLAIGRHLFLTGLSMQVGGIAALIMARLDQLFVASRLPIQDMGFYAVGLTVGSIGTGILSGALQTVYMPRLSAERDPARRDAEFRHATIVTLVGGLLMAGLVALLAPVLVPLVYGAEFAAAVTTAALLAVAQAFAAYVAIATLLLRLRGDWMTGAIAPAVGAGVLLVILAVLPATAGIAAVALSLVVAYAAAFMCVIARVAMTLHLSLAACLAPTRSDAEEFLALMRARVRA